MVDGEPQEHLSSTRFSQRTLRPMGHFDSWEDSRATRLAWVTPGTEMAGLGSISWTTKPHLELRPRHARVPSATSPAACPSITGSVGAPTTALVRAVRSASVAWRASDLAAAAESSS